MQFSQTILLGHLTRDPQLKYLPSQTACCEFGVAVNRKWKTDAGEEREDVLFMDCTAYGKRGEVINQYMKKGSAIFVVGSLRFDQWEDKNGGGKRSKHSLTVEDFQFVGGRPEGEGEQRQQKQSIPTDRRGRGTR